MADEKTLRESLQKGATIAGKFAECKDSDDELAVINEIDTWAGDVEELLEVAQTAPTMGTPDTHLVEHYARVTRADLHKALDRALEAYAENVGSLEVESRQNVKLLGKDVVVSIVISHPDAAVVLRTT